MRKKCNIEERRERERKNGKKCSDRDGRRQRRRCNIEERMEREKKWVLMQRQRWKETEKEVQY